ncbi:MAG: serine/threonine protein kinase [Deltaproteobacteria bacterium]|nr:serine/threonine protein kinase [Deltaproteobacteria bacterium]
MALDLPQTFGKYVLLRKLAVGGMAEVFLAKYLGAEGFQRTVVIKRILPSYTEDEAFVSMFIDEARIAAALHHASIVQVIDFDMQDDAYYIAMEYIDGRDLRRIIDLGTKADLAMTPLMTAHAVAHIASGLHYAHTRKSDEGEPLNIIHRDVSPHNIMISLGGDVKLADFGIAKAAARSTKTRAGTVKGKCAYMSPEQAKGKPLDPRSDLFALCTVTWEMLTYKRLFEGDSDFEILNNVLNQSVPPPSLFRKSVPRELDAIILKGLRKDPKERYANLAALEKDLQNFVFKQASGRDELDLASYMRRLLEADGGEQGNDSKPTPKMAAEAKSAPSSEAGTELLSEDREITPRQAPEPEAETLAIDVSDGSPPTTVPVGLLKEELEEVLAAYETVEEEYDAAGGVESAPTVALPESEVRAVLTDTGDDLRSTGNLKRWAASRTDVRAGRASRAAMWLFFVLVGVALGIGGFYGVMAFGDSEALFGESPVESIPTPVRTDPGSSGVPVVVTPDTGPAMVPDVPAVAAVPDVSSVDGGQVATAGKDALKPAAVQAAVVTLEVSPAKARVRVDGRIVQPKDGKRVLADRFEVGDRLFVEAMASGFRTHRKSYEVTVPEELIAISLARPRVVKPRPKPKPVPTATGFVTINARPWAHVYHKGVKVGTTPLRRREFPVGRQVFKLKNETATKTITITVDKGSTTSRVVDM